MAKPRLSISRQTRTSSGEAICSSSKNPVWTWTSNGPQTSGVFWTKPCPPGLRPASDRKESVAAEDAAGASARARVRAAASREPRPKPASATSANSGRRAQPGARRTSRSAKTDARSDMGDLPHPTLSQLGAEMGRVPAGTGYSGVGIRTIRPGLRRRELRVCRLPSVRPRRCHGRRREAHDLPPDRPRPLRRARLPARDRGRACAARIRCTASSRTPRCRSGRSRSTRTSRRSASSPTSS